MLFLWYQYGNLLKNYVKINILLLMGHVLGFSLYALSFCFPLSSILIFLSYCTTTMISVATIFYHRYHFIMTPPLFYENNFWLPKIFQTLSIWHTHTTSTIRNTRVYVRLAHLLYLSFWIDFTINWNMTFTGVNQIGLHSLESHYQCSQTW